MSIGRDRDGGRSIGLSCQTILLPPVAAVDMAAMSSSTPGATTLTPPSSSHGNGNEPGWKSYAPADYDDDDVSFFLPPSTITRPPSICSRSHLACCRAQRAVWFMSPLPSHRTKITPLFPHPAHVVC